MNEGAAFCHALLRSERSFSFSVSNLKNQFNRRIIHPTPQSKASKMNTSLTKCQRKKILFVLFQSTFWATYRKKHVLRVVFV